MSSWIVGIAVAVVAATVALLYLWLVRRVEVENDAGLRALAALRWREFSTLVVRAMQTRGLRDAGSAAPEQANAGNEARLLMTDGSKRWLLSCKHGMAYRIQASNIRELASEMDMAGATSGILLTQGRADREALSAAQRAGVEIIDGRRLWQLLKPFLAVATTRRIVDQADAQARRHSVIAVMGALVLGLLVGVVLSNLMPARSSAAPAASSAAAVAPAAATAPAATPRADAAPAANPAAATAPAPGEGGGALDEATIARHQAEIARTLSTRAGIHRAYWLTRTTLVIDRSGAGSDKLIWPLVCGELENYPAVLRTVRVQLNPRPGSGETVRWRQCFTV